MKNKSIFCYRILLHRYKNCIICKILSCIYIFHTFEEKHHILSINRLKNKTLNTSNNSVNTYRILIVRENYRQTLPDHGLIRLHRLHATGTCMNQSCFSPNSVYCFYNIYTYTHARAHYAPHLIIRGLTFSSPQLNEQ